MFVPKLFVTLRSYTREQFYKDFVSGIVVGVVALPLCIAFAIASGVSPEKGLVTGVIGGFLISFLGGSRVQIGGPTGAFIVIIYGIVQQFGIEGLIYATFMAGIMLVIMGIARMGAVIKFIPHPLIVGFTSGIALIIFSSQVKDFFGLSMGTVPVDFVSKWKEYFLNFGSINKWSIAIAGGTVLIAAFLPKITRKVPGSLVAILLSTFAVLYLHLDVETIGSKFGEIPSSFPMPHIPGFDFSMIQKLIQPAFTIALLGGIESLLSAVVADGMIGGNHKSNVELLGQGIANIVSAFFGGIPATGALARTATNVKSGGRTPIAGIVHAITLLIIMLVVGKWATLIPLSCLAGILVVVAYNMSEWRSFIGVLRTSKSDAAVMLVTFFLTVFIDLTVAIEIGMVLAVFLFMRRMTQISNVNIITKDMNEADDDKAISRYKVPEGVEVFEVTGPMFFGAAYKFKESLKLMAKSPKILIIRMRFVPVIDATGLHTLEEVFKQAKNQGTKFILSGVQKGIYNELEKSRLIFQIGKANVCPDIDAALARAEEVLNQKG
ncbi:MAG: sulfate permease [Bacteroidetes bacterium]|nr:sulfate permease [Bacteroidota bacterium]